jgi:hypothetical protein
VLDDELGGGVPALADALDDGLADRPGLVGYRGDGVADRLLGVVPDLLDGLDAVVDLLLDPLLGGVVGL